MEGEGERHKQDTARQTDRPHTHARAHTHTHTHARTHLYDVLLALGPQQALLPRRLLAAGFKVVMSLPWLCLCRS